MRILHVAAEIYPLVKTGGLADVVAALPPGVAVLSSLLPKPAAAPPGTIWSFRLQTGR